MPKAIFYLLEGDGRDVGFNLEFGGRDLEVGASDVIPTPDSDFENPPPPLLKGIRFVACPKIFGILNVRVVMRVFATSGSSWGFGSPGRCPVQEISFGLPMHNLIP